MKDLVFLIALCFSGALAQFESYENFVVVESQEEAIVGSYIVVLKGELSTLDTVPGFEDSYVHARYDSVFNGYNLRNVPDEFITQVLESDDVEAVYQDAEMHAIPIDEYNPARGTQVIGPNGPWGLDR